MKQTDLNKKRKLRKNRAKQKVGRGTENRPRLSVFRSNKNIYGQLIDDFAEETIVSASSYDVKDDKLTKTEEAEKVGEILAERADKAGIEKVIFDKGSYDYHGRIKALADGAREGGLNF